MPDLPVIVTMEDVRNPNLLVRILRSLADGIVGVGTKIDALARSIKFPSIVEIRDALQSTGSYPLNLTNLRGISVDPQPANVSRFTTAPTGQILQQLKDGQLVLVIGPPTTLNYVTGGNPNTLTSILPTGAVHNILSATHSDSLTASVVRGDIITGNSTPKWARLAKGTANQVLRMDSGATDPGWGSVADSVLSANVMLLNAVQSVTGVKTFDSTATFNQTVTVAADLNVGTGQFSSTSQVGCYAYRSAALSLSDATVTAIGLDAEVFDTGACHSNVTNNSRITVPTGAGGRWLLIAQIAFASNATGLRLIRIKKNGTTVIARGFIAANNGDATILSCMTMDFSAVATDYYEMEGYQTSGGSLALAVTDSGTTFMQAAKIA